MPHPPNEEYPYVYCATGPRKGQRCRVIKPGWRTRGYGSRFVQFEDGTELIVNRLFIRRTHHGSSTSETAASHDPKA